MSLMTIAELDKLEQRHSYIIPAPVQPAPKRPPITKRDAQHEILGAIKIIARMNGMDMTKDVHPTELLVSRIDELEAQADQLHKENEALRKALAAVGTVLEVHDDPFELKPSSKWSKAEMGNLIIGMCESIKWVMQRAENALDPQHAVPIVPDPET
jgi:hypothetical protein